MTVIRRTTITLALTLWSLVMTILAATSALGQHASVDSRAVVKVAFNRPSSTGADGRTTSSPRTRAESRRAPPPIRGGTGYLGDKKPGDVKGQAFFSEWFVLLPRGKPITS